MATGNRTKASPSRSAAAPAITHAELSPILGRFNDALAVAQTAAHALEAAQLAGTFDALCTLAQAVILLRKVYSELDLAIVNLQPR